VTVSLVEVNDNVVGTSAFHYGVLSGRRLQQEAINPVEHRVAFIVFCVENMRKATLKPAEPDYS
jgi:hypothetical protein